MRRALRWLRSTAQAGVDFTMALVGLTFVAVVYVLALAIVIALLLPYLIRRFRRWLEAGSPESLLRRTRAARSPTDRRYTQAATASRPQPKAGSEGAPSQDSGRGRVDLGPELLPWPGAATAPSTSGQGFPTRTRGRVS